MSEFIRNAVSERTKRILSDRTSERLADVIGTVRAGGGQAARTGKAFAELISEQHATK